MLNEITSIATLLTAIADSRHTAKAHAHVRVWFRGQGDESWRLEPGVYRTGFADDDEARIKKERHLTQDFVAMSAPLRPGNQSDADIYFLQQHYQMPTRLLDWSLNPLAALFFALEPADRDGVLFLLDAYQFEPKHRGLCTPRSDEVQTAMRAIFQWVDIWPPHILPVRPFDTDRRITAQRGCFTFHPPAVPQLTKASNPSLLTYRIPQDAKASLRRELTLLGIDEFQIYGDLDHLAERLKRAYR